MEYSVEDYNLEDWTMHALSFEFVHRGLNLQPRDIGQVCNPLLNF